MLLDFLHLLVLFRRPCRLVASPNASCGYTTVLLLSALRHLSIVHQPTLPTDRPTDRPTYQPTNLHINQLSDTIELPALPSIGGLGSVGAVGSGGIGK